MIYNLSNPLDRERFKVRTNKLYKDGKIVELTEKKPQRTVKQNAYLHLILSWFAIETGNSVEFVKQEYFKRLCNKHLFVREIEDKYLGKIEVLRSSSDLDTEEMTLAIQRFRDWSASEAGIYLPDAMNKDFLLQIEIEISKNKQYL